MGEQDAESKLPLSGAGEKDYGVYAVVCHMRCNSSFNFLCCYCTRTCRHILLTPQLEAKRGISHIHCFL